MENFLLFSKQHDPVSYLAQLKVLGRDQEREDFMNSCKESCKQFTIYVVGYLEPWFDELRA